MSIAKALAEARKAAGMTQRQLAEAMGLSQATIALVEHGRRKLGLRNYSKLPQQIRSRVIDAALAETRAQAEALEALRGKV